MPDPLYVRARTVLLDAVEALGAHLDAIVLVGAQAIYLQTGDADLAVAEYTTDADFTISPGELSDAPLLDALLGAAGFTAREHPGGWLSRDGIYVDIMVPERSPGLAPVVLDWDRTASEQPVAPRASRARSSIASDRHRTACASPERAPDRRPRRVGDEGGARRPAQPVRQ